MIPFVDWIALPAAPLGIVGMFWFSRLPSRIPTANVFLCSDRQPRVGHIKRVVPFFIALWLLGVGLWVGGRMTQSGVGHFFGGLLLLGTQLVWILGWLLLRDLKQAAGKLEFMEGPDPRITLDVDGESRMIELTEGSIRAWTVGNGVSGPQCLQLALGENAETGIALFVVPSMRQWALSEGASWLPSYGGWGPIARGTELLDLLAPYIVPANADWRPS